jgi:4-azaleucine resistance transporter AzlC
VFGVAFGVLATTNGLSTAQACALSILVFTGASQFSAVAVIGAGGSDVAALGGALLLAVRNGVYGLSVGRLFGSDRGRWWRAQLVIDESSAMALAQPTPELARVAFMTTGVAVFVLWNAGTLAGAVLGETIGDPASLGLDAAFPAAFCVLIGAHVRTMRGRRAAVVGGVLALAGITVLALPEGLPILIAVAAATIVAVTRWGSAER